MTLSEFARPWFAITNTDLEVGVGVAWTAEQYPYACLWQETGGAQREPHAAEYVLAIEPQSSYPGHGLGAVAASTATQLTLEPGETRTAAMCAVLYEGGRRVADVALDGTVTRA